MDIVGFCSVSTFEADLLLLEMVPKMVSKVTKIFTSQS